MKSTINKISALLVLVLMLATFSVSANGSTATDVVKYSVTVDGNEVENVFVGEVFEVNVSLDSFSEFTAAEFAFRFDSSKIKLISYPTTEDPSGTVISEIVKKKSANKYVTGGYGILPSTSFYAPESSEGADDGYRYIKNIYLSNNMGFIRFLLQAEIGESFDSVSEVIKFRFQALEATTVDEKVFRYADSSIDTGDFQVDFVNDHFDSVPSGCKFAGDEGEIVISDANKVIPEINIYEKPVMDEATLSWVDYYATWEAPEMGCRGYIVNIYRNDELIAENIKCSDTTYGKPDATDPNIGNEIFKLMKSKGKGTYYFTVVAVGGTYNSDPVRSPDKEMLGIPLENVNNLTYDSEDNILKWDAVTDATVYTVTVTDGKGNEEKFDTSDIENSMDGYIGIGDYTISVVAKNESDLYIPSGEVTITYSSGSLVSGSVSLYAKNAASLKYNVQNAAKVLLIPEEGSTIEITVNSDGTFEKKGVPNGTYTVKITRLGAVARTLTNTITLSESIEKSLCAQDKSLTVFITDYDESSVVDVTDLAAVIAHQQHYIADFKNKSGENTEAEKSKFYAMDNIKESVAGVDAIIEADELSLTLHNFGKSTTDYTFDEYKAEEHDYVPAA